MMTASNNNNNKERKTVSAKGQKLRFYAVVSSMVLLCAGFIWFIFRPVEQPADDGVAGINPMLPAATVRETEIDKRKAYENEQLRSKEEMRQRILQNLADSAAVEGSGDRTLSNPVVQSRQTYEQVNRQVATFYQPPREDPQVAELRRQVEELTEKLNERQSSAPQKRVDPMEMMERSYELAARYFPQGGVSGESAAGATFKAGKSGAITNGGGLSVVSSLASGPANSGHGFHTVSSAVSEGIRAVIAGEQTVRDGDRVTLRLTDALTVSGTAVPAHTLVYGTAHIERQRVNITIVSIEVAGIVIPVSFAVYDTDGQPGLYVPNSAERTAAKSAAGAMGTSAGSSLSVTRGAGAQIAADLSRGALSAASQYLSTKLTEVRITLKKGYQLYLISEQ